MKVVVATRNRHKVEEIRALLADANVELVSAGEIPRAPDVAEDGETFEANAIKKAEALMRFAGLPALADDSGLEVDALGGRPGVRSARYAGERATDADNLQKLLQELNGCAARSARFRCVMALAHPEMATRVVEGSCEGTIIEGPRGRGGFGYDPVFVAAGERRTFAEMPAAEKNAMSHRARAMARMKALLQSVE